MDVAAIKDFFRDHRDAMIDDLRTLVEHESPSRDKVALDALAYWLSIRLAGLGGSVSRIANDQGGDHLLARFDAPTGANPALILGHFDTVWPLGTIDTRPFAIDGDRAYGPGSYDMKASLAIVFAAIGAIRATGGKLPGRCSSC